MAGVVAMASVIEDFDTQPCKKSRKDGGNPVVKTITNYFSPVPKPAEKPFSPPRSNNIADYFNRRSSKEKTSSPEQSKENCQRSQSVEKHISPEAAVKQPTRKRGRKGTKAARKLVETENGKSSEEGSCFILEDLPSNRDSVAQATSSCGVFGSDTAALLYQLNSDTCAATGITETVTKDEHKDDCPKSEDCVEPKPLSASSPVLPSKEKSKQMRSTARNSSKSRHQEAKHSVPEDEEATAVHNSLCDTSMEVNVDEASQLNRSTVISFEDFVRSQSQDEGEAGADDALCKGDDGKIPNNAEDMDIDRLGVQKDGEHVASGEQSLQVSPRTVTIQAEVHAVSPKQEAVKSIGKVASIFNKRKGSACLSEVSPSQTESANHAACSPLTAKRKSNVVLQEEDLELDVIEVESTPKSSDAERKQFMAAFKQPGTDTSKSKLGKSQGKQKPTGEKVPDAEDKAEDATTQEHKVAPKKPGRRGRKKSEVEKEAVVSEPPAEASPPSPPVEESAIADPEVEAKKEEPSSTPAVRRSRREAVVRQIPTTSTTAPVRNVTKKDRSKDGTASPKDTPETISTPKTRRSKHVVYVAEMVAPPDTQESPIRIKFTRVHKNVPKPESSINSPLTSKVSNDDKKRKKAKKLVEKAKAIQQSKKATLAVKGALRRSSRAEASLTRSYCEDEDSIICLEENKNTATQVVPEKKKPQKPMRSLNDVLGRAKTPAVSKAVPLSQEKNGRRASAVVSIFDESSREGSENSQDDEQFRARREFLKSGLPDSFRKQIAKASAIKEAYTISSHCFHPVIHATQPETDCPLWSLPWPGSSLLSHLKEVWSRPPSQPLAVGCSFDVKKEPAHRHLCEKGSGWRPELSEPVRQLLMEEISCSNPTFPSQMFITRFLARRAEHQQHCTASEGATRVTNSSSPAEPAGGKRKRVDDEGGKVAKKQRAIRSDENKPAPAEPEPPKRGGRTRRSQRGRLDEEAAKAMPSPRGAEDDCVILLDEEDGGKKDEVKEDVLWTDKYQPQHSSDIIGNKTAVRRLHSWLKEWKLRADREERNKQKDKKQEEGSNDSDWDLGEDGDDSLCNTILITGPTGVGKTAAVYACAQELGFKVFEVNASSLRSGRLILSQLKEATQSHQVDSQGVNAHKPTYFNSYGTSSSAGTVRPGMSPRKINSPRRVVSSPRKNPHSPRGAKRGGLAPTALANFFKMGRPTNKEPVTAKKEEKKAASKNVNGNEAATKRFDAPPKLPAVTTSKETNEEQGKKSPTSLILFEEVDVIFDEDSGFLAAIKTFMMTTKRPVILTTSDPAFSTMFDGNFEEIHFKSPSLLNVSSYLRLICLAEDMRTDPADVTSLLRLNGCDIRLSLLQLQYWTRSAGGRHVTRPLQLNERNELKPKSHEGAADIDTVLLPPCDTSCTESVLGLLNIEPEKDIWELLRSQADNVACWELLIESNRQGVHLLYSNMEALLPLPTTHLTSTHKPEWSLSASQDPPSANPSTCPQSDTLPSHPRLLLSSESADCSDDGSPVKVSHRMKTNKRQHHLSDMDGLNLDSDSDDGFLSLSKTQAAPQAKEETKETLVSEKPKRKPLTPDERAKSLPVSQTLESIADFLDDMSNIDSSLHLHRGGGNHRRNLPASAVVKDGMMDESRVESDRLSWARGERELEIQAAVEALSFHRCRLSVAKAWDGAQRLGGEVGRQAAEELSLPVASHRQGYSFTQDGPCEPQLVQRRRDILESLMFRGVSGTLGNRSLAALDYLPALRAICRSEQLKEQGKVKRRFLHYLDSIHLGLEKGTLQHLADEFP